MGRAKASMELISNKKSRRVTYEKRRKGLEKKAHELSTLCGVKVGLIIYGARDANRPMDPNIWPENHQEILSLINSYKEENVEDRRRRTSDLSMFYRDQTKKAEEELTRLHKKNIEAKHPTWDNHFDTLTSEELRQFGGLFESKLQTLRARLDFMKGTQTYFADSASAGSSSMIPSIDQNAELQLQDQNNPYIVQSLFKRSSMQLEIIQQQPVATFTLPQYGVDVPFHKSFNSFSANTLGNQKTMMLMNDDGVSNNSSMYNTDKSLAMYNYPAIPGVPENVDGNQVEAPLRYYIPAMQPVPVPVFVQYPSQSRGSSQMHKAQVEEYNNQMGYFK